MHTSVALLLMVALTILGLGCQTGRKSAFISNFSLDKSVQDIGYKGIDYGRMSGGVGGGMGGSPSEIGRGSTKVQNSLISSTGFRIKEQGEDKFEEREFIDELKSQLKKEIEANHASVIASDSTGPNEFYIEYKEGEIKGRITITGSGGGKFYSLKAQVDERNKP